MFILDFPRLAAGDYWCFFCGKVRVRHPMDNCAKCGEVLRKRSRS